MKKIGVLLLVIMMFSASWILASGLAIPEQGTAAMGMSAAMTARSEDLSSIFYNPAGIDYVENSEIMLGITPIIPQHEYNPFRKDAEAFSDIFSIEDAKSKTFLPPQLYAAYRVNQNIVLGLGVYAPFGLGTEWDKTWNGRYTSTLAEIQTIYINPTISYSATETVSIGAGVSYVTSKATLEKMTDTGSILFEGMGSNPALASIIANPDYDSHFALDGDGIGFAYNFGVLIRTIENLQLGVSYRGAMDIDYEGKAKFKHEETTIKNTVIGAAMAQGADAATAAATADGVYNSIAAEMPASQDGKATLHMPWMLNFGLKYDMSEIWDVSADIDIVGWKVYDEITIDFDMDKPYDKLKLDKDWQNSYIMRFGSSYDINESFIGRCGLLLDLNPVPDKTMDGQLPDSNRYGISIGAGYKIGMMQLDASYMLLNFLDRDKNNGVGFSKDITGDGVINRFDIPERYPVGNGKYESLAHLLSVSASYKF